MAEARSYTPDELRTLISTVCGEVVANALKGLTAQTTKNGEALADGAAQQTQKKDRKKGVIFGAVLGALALAKMDIDRAIKHAKTEWKDEEVVKALEASTITNGGALIAPEHSSDFIDLLTARSVILQRNPVIVPMDSGVIDVPKQTAAASAYYVGEQSDATASQQKFGSVVLRARKLAALVPVGNSLLRRGGPSVAGIVRNDALRAVSLRQDLAFIRGNGTEFTPRGLRYWAPAANVIAANGTVNLTNVTADLGKLVLALEEANVALTNPGWLFAPRTKQYLLTVRDANGNYAFRDEMLKGTLWGWPYATTTQIPKNLGGGTNESEVYLVDFDDAAVGRTGQLLVDISTEAAFIDPDSGQLVSAFSKDLSVLRIIDEHDFAMRHTEAVAVLTGVTWAP